MNYEVEVAKSLINKGAVRVNAEEPFTWISGIRSPIYCDNRLMISHVDARNLILEAFVAKIDMLGLKFDYLAGTATAGIPWAAFLADKLNVPMVYVRSAPKGHGASKQVEGDGVYLNAQKVLIIEDLISTGGSSINTVQALQKELNATDVFVLSIVDYGLEIAKSNFKNSGIKYSSLTNFEVLLSVSDIAHKDKVLSFAADPKNWFDNL